ncbi:30629_t:CDS:2, partial [Gigaspora margarita]
MSVKRYNKLLESKASCGYKYKRYMFMIDMFNPDYSEFCAFLITLFGTYNNRPMIIDGNVHYSPDGFGEIAPDITIRPNEIYVPKPTVPHPGPPS